VAQERLRMRKIMDILRLHALGQNKAEIARALILSRGAVIRTLNRFQASGLTWPLPDDATNQTIEDVLYGPLMPKAAVVAEPADNHEPTLYAQAHSELTKNKHLTLKLLHEEWKNAKTIDLSYSRFCHHYRAYKKGLGRSFTNTYIGGEYSFIDFSGDSIGLIPPGGGDKIKTELLVWCFGASNLTYWEFLPTQKQGDLFAAMEHGMAYFGCVSKICVVDNMKTAVTRACRYEPQVNTLFSDFAEHHGFCVYPARPYHPKDKAKVEVAVLLAQRYLLASLRNTDFYDLNSLNQKARVMLDAFNGKVMRRYGKSRRELFESLDRPSCLPRRIEPYTVSHITNDITVNPSYHVEVLGNLYSVPHRYCGQKVYAKATLSSVAILSGFERVCLHARLHGEGQKSTVAEHMPASHRAHVEGRRETLLCKAQGIGQQTHAFCKAIFAKENHLLRAERTVLGVLRLGKSQGVDVLEKACEFGIQYQCIGYGHLKRILTQKLYLHRAVDDSLKPLPMHENVRGESWYQGEELP
jgi:transposase